MNTYWWSQRKQKNVLFVKYEEMHQDLSSVILKVSKFLGWPVPDGKLADIVLQCSFDSMKSNRKVNFSEHPLMNIESYPFMRKGIVGDWIHYFTKTQTEKFDELYEQKILAFSLSI
ncbi:sulfotransferase 1C2A-like [Antedon mediterranea]|uniref:sulfotransferase 1C2A-like n=1 Tax=Antedon mediterranea TaxID=105859 RepID=UPI003AF5A84A